MELCIYLSFPRAVIVSVEAILTTVVLDNQQAKRHLAASKIGEVLNYVR